MAGTCLFAPWLKLNCLLVGWLGGNFLLYRIGLYHIGWHGICPCMGTLTSVIHISPALGNLAMKIMAAVLLLGSVAVLALLKNPRAVKQADTVPQFGG